MPDRTIERCYAVICCGGQNDGKVAQNHNGWITGPIEHCRLMAGFDDRDDIEWNSFMRSKNKCTDFRIAPIRIVEESEN